MAHQNSKPLIHHNFGLGASIVRSLSQPTFFANNPLPPLSPFPLFEPSMASANPSLKDAIIENVDGRECVLRGGDDLPESIASVVSEGVKRKASGDIAPITLHFRSLSMDNAFASLISGDKSQKLPSSLGNQVGQLSPRSTFNERSPKLSLVLRSGEFSEDELKKIMADERLAEVAITDPKQAKRILANRHSAARSKERKMHYISELEHKVNTLQTEATTLSAQVTILQKDLSGLKSENNELNFRLQAMGHRAQLRDALNESLTAEIRSLKLAMGELREEGKLSNRLSHEISQKHHMFQMQCQNSGQVQVSYCQ